MINYPNSRMVRLTMAGQSIAQPSLEPITSTDQFHQAEFVKLPMPQVQILKALIACYSASLSHEQLAQQAGQSSESSEYINNLSALRSLGVIDYPNPGWAVATQLLFIDVP